MDLIDFDAENMIYALPVAIKDIKKGSVIKHVSGNPVFVTSVENGIHVVDVVNSEKKEIVPTKSLFGFDYVTQIVPIIDFSSSNASEANPFGNLLPFLMLSNSKNEEGFSMKNLLPIMFLTQSQKSGENNTPFGNFDMSNPFIWMAFMGNEENKNGGSNDSDFFPILMMAGMMNQKKDQK